MRGCRAIVGSRAEGSGETPIWLVGQLNWADVAVPPAPVRSVGLWSMESKAIFQPENRSLCGALRRLRLAIVVSCWVISLSLCAQTVIWSLATYTDMRYGQPESSADVPLIVTAQDRPDQSIYASVGPVKDPRLQGAASATGTPDPAGVERTLSSHDRTFRIVVTTARALGLVSVLLIGPLLALGVVLAVPAGAPKVDRAVTALIWAIVLSLLAMPVGEWLSLPWQEGALSSYSLMMAEVEAARAEGFSLAFYVRFLLLPAASLVGFILVGFRFGSAVEAVLLKSESMGLDPALEREAANISATSLHGDAGRMSGALTHALHADEPLKASHRERMPAATKVSPAEMPKRLI